MLPPGLAALGILFSLALVAQALGWWAIVSALPKLKAARGGLVILLQPVLATVWGVIFFAEHLTVLQVFGAALTLGAVYFGSMRQRA
jgi:drug/metabolite transporter (DMT)-like permease